VVVLLLTAGVVLLVQALGPDAAASSAAGPAGNLELRPGIAAAPKLAPALPESAQTPAVHPKAAGQPTKPPVEDKPGPPPKLEVAIVKTDPSQPREGESLTIYLRAPPAGPNPVKLEYRLDSRGKWLTVVGDRVRLKRLRPGSLILQIRALDSRGRPGPVLEHRWKIESVPRGGLRVGDTFYQQVVIRRRSAYHFAGSGLAQDMEYRFVSCFAVEKRTDGGNLIVRQKVLSARFGRGDQAAQARLKGALQKVKGTAFTITLSPRREVTKFEGNAGGIEVVQGADLLGQSFLFWSFLDRDGWKELAQATLFRPDKPSGSLERWSRKLTHAWGPLGSWDGRTVYAYAGKKAGLDRIAYAHEMAYRPPGRGAADGLLRVVRAAFQPQVARGTILFDPKRGRVAAAEEAFAVKGSVVVDLLGANTPIDLEETQVFELRVLDEKPADK
jgi:hypothetical protein